MLTIKTEKSLLIRGFSKTSHRGYNYKCQNMVEFLLNFRTFDCTFYGLQVLLLLLAVLNIVYLLRIMSLLSVLQNLWPACHGS